MGQTSIEWTATQHPDGSWTPGYSFNPWWGCQRVSPGCQHCLDPHTLVLYADMIWRPIGGCRPGDVLMGFDEQPRPFRARQFKEAVVENVWWSSKETRRLITESADILTSPNHRWLRPNGARWPTTEHLMRHRGGALRTIGYTQDMPETADYMQGYITGITLGDGTFRYTPGQRSDKMGDPQAYWRVALADEQPLGRLVWYLSHFGVAATVRPFHSGKRSGQEMFKVEVRALQPLRTLHWLINTPLLSDEYARGFLAGFFDAEGSAGDSLRVSQNEPATLQRFCSYGARFGFRFTMESYSPANGREMYYARLLGPLKERIRFFSTVKPAIRRKMRSVFDKRMETDDDPILAVERGPVSDLVDIQTSTGTFFAAGIATHNCYAETLAHRYGVAVWGPAKTTQRRAMSENYWNQPRRWNERARRAGQSARVFCASMADVFEAHPQVGPWRDRLWTLIDETPSLDWLLLTKRPENILPMIPAAWQHSAPLNVWYGTSIENQEQANIRIPELLKVPAVVRFLSCEPLLGPLIFDICEQEGDEYGDGAVYSNMLTGERWMRDGFEKELRGTAGIQWVIAGGESGAHARPAHPDWFRRLRDQCQVAGVPFFMKQWGAFAPYDGQTKNSVYIVRPDGTHEQTGITMTFGDEALMERVSKKAAGRLLDDREWSEFPRVSGDIA